MQNTSTNWCMWCQTIWFLYAIDSDTMIRQAIIHWWPAGRPSLIPCNSSERCSDVFHRPIKLYGMHQESILQLRRGHCKEDPSNSRGENEGLVSAGMHGGASFARIRVFFPTIWHYNKIIRYIIAIWKLIPVVIGNFPIVTIAVTSCNMVQLFFNSNHFLTMHSVG